MLRTAAWAALYLVAGLIGRATIIDGHSLALVWPAAGVGALWLLTSHRPWLAVDVVVLATTVYAVNAVTGATPALAALFVVTNLLQVVVFVTVMRRARPDMVGFGGPAAPGSLTDLGALIGAALLSCLLAAGLGQVGLAWFVDGSTWAGFLVWWGRNTSGLLVVGVLGLLLQAQLQGATGAGDVARRLAALVWPGRRQAAEAALLSALSAVLLLLVFARAEAAPIGFLLLFTSVLAGVRLSPCGVVLHGFAAGSGAIYFTLQGLGPFAAVSGIADRALVAQVFVAMTVVTGLVLCFSRAERNQAMADLQALQAETADRARLFGAVLEHMREGITVVDGEGRVLLRNPAGRRLTGLEDGDVVGLDPDGARWGLAHPDGTPVAARDLPVTRALAGEEVLADYRFTAPGATEPVTLEVTASQLPRASEEEPVRAIVSFRDVTAARHDRDALASFAGVVAHDLKRPLTVINGWSEALAEDFGIGPVDPQAGLRTLGRITGAARQMGSFIDDLLSYTVVRDAPVLRVDVDLSKAAEESAAVFRERESRPQVYVQTGLHATADPVMVRQILDNLIGNATKYVAPGVRPRVQVRGREDAEWTVLSVTDNGIGVPVEHREKVFASFHRAHGENYRGTGLGLAIVRRAVERCGGSVVLRENPSGGSIFEVRLPAAVPAVLPLHPGAEPLGAPVGTRGRDVAHVGPAPAPVVAAAREG
ncbi:PAS domain S-box-containing protein [Nocardioides scoriae]|uniref:Sensor-like histidine kinase SenX3 n=1 Tax=Nocardioides scoriae TaxID=642780 RepID=A0A1H1V9S6_9ACTN|nr:PAS domain S-box-containing protein [Nocardioides scoriae]